MTQLRWTTQPCSPKSKPQRTLPGQPRRSATMRLRLIAVGALLADIPISVVARSLWGLTGVTIALGVSTLLLVLALMASLSLRMLTLSALGLARLSLLVGAATALAFGGASLVLSAVPAAAAGLALYALLLMAMRELGLSQAWRYVRALH